MIHYLLPAATRSGDLLGAVGAVLSALVVFAVMLYLAYMATKLIGKRYGGGNGRNVRVLETVPLGQNKHLFLVKAADKTLLLGCAKEGITCLAELDADSLLPPEQNGEPLDFTKALKQATLARFGKAKPAPPEKKGADEDDA